MIGTSKTAYVLIRIAAWGLSSVTPLLLSAAPVSHYFGIHCPWWLKLWAAGEGIFLFYFIYQKRIANQVFSSP